MKESKRKRERKTYCGIIRPSGQEVIIERGEIQVRDRAGVAGDHWHITAEFAPGLAQVHHANCATAWKNKRNEERKGNERRKEKRGMNEKKER